MCIEIPPKYSVASVIEFLKGKQCNFSGEAFWARGDAVSTVSFELEAMKRYIREQDKDIADKSSQF